MATSLEGLCRTEEQRHIAKTLSERGILTDGDLILADTASLSKLSSLSQRVCSEDTVLVDGFQELDGFCNDIIYSSIHPIRADKLLSSTESPQRISTGYKLLNEILRGGLLPGSITEFAGSSNTGKTLVPPLYPIHRIPSSLFPRLQLFRDPRLTEVTFQHCPLAFNFLSLRRSSLHRYPRDI